MRQIPLAPQALYRAPLGLLTDLYQLTMAYGYWKSGIHNRESVFHLFFRSAPFHNGFALSAGLESAAGFIENFGFSNEELTYLETLQGNDKKPLFEAAFLDFLRDLRFTGDIDGVPEGTAVFGNEPILRVKAPLLEAQLLETALLTIVNFATLVTTKAARIVAAAEGDPVIEFGLRRAQGIDGGITATRSAFLGGCVGTSNVVAGKIFNIPVKGTHAHSWVMSFDSEEEAFATYADAMPNNCIFLVDTYDTVEGVRKAIETGKELRKKGHEMVGIRLDSGDLAELSIAARSLLDEGGFPDAHIVASNDIDEHVVASLKMQGAKVDTWGVGTKLVTAFDQPALGGVYKLAAIRDSPDQQWDYRIKLSNSPGKTSNPGIQQIRRVRDSNGTPLRDIIYCEETGVPDEAGDDLLQPIFRKGEMTWTPPTLEEARTVAREEWDTFGTPPVDVYEYSVELEPRLEAVKADLMKSAQKGT